MFEAVAFYLFAALSASMFLVVVTTNNVLYALTALAGGMIFISAFFFMLGVEFLGAVQIVVYTGAIMALYAFGMIFFDSSREIKEREGNPIVLWSLTGIIGFILLVILSAPFAHIALEPANKLAGELGDMGNIQAIGYVLFTKYLVPFELAAVMLLVAMIAGIVLAGKKMDKSLTLISDEEAEALLKKSKKRSF